MSNSQLQLEATLTCEQRGPLGPLQSTQHVERSLQEYTGVHHFMTGIPSENMSLCAFVIV